MRIHRNPDIHALGRTVGHRDGPPADPGAAGAHDPDWPAEFLDFYDRFFGRLTAMAAGIIERPDVAKDLVQDAMLVLAGRWHDVEKPFGFVRRCVVNACIDHLRHQQVRRRFRRSRRAHDLVQAPTEIDEMSRLLGGLSPRRQTALALRYHDELPDSEIAQLMDCTEATVRSLVYRGLEQLRERLA